AAGVGLGWAEFGAVNERDILALEVAAGFLAALEMAGDDDEEQVAELGFKALEHAGEDGLLPGVGAAGDDDTVGWFHAKLLEQGGDVDAGALGEDRAIELEIADDVDGFRTAAELDEAPGIGF